MENDGRKASRAEYVYEILEKEILSGELPRGDLLTEQKLSERLGVSRTPVREALNRLLQEELLEETPKGIRVIGINMADLCDMFDIRMRLEGMAARSAAERITPEEIGALRETLELQEYYTQKNAAAHIRDMDSKFHEQIFEFCGKRTLCSVLTALHRKVQRYRKISVENPGRALEVATEHRAIFEAIAAHDGALADRRATDHIINARKSILAVTEL